MSALGGWWNTCVLTSLLVSSAAGAAPGKPYTRNVAIVLYDGVEVLDFSGPAEVFAAAGSHAMSGDQKAFRPYTVSRTKAPLTSQGFLKIVPDYSIEDAPKPDIIVIPGGNTGVVLRDEAFMKWISKSATESELTLTVCTGAMTLGKAGLLDGLDVTTFYNAIDGLQKLAPKARVHRGRRFIDNGHFVTTAGVSAGIDGSLHVVARLLGKRVADETAQYMEYRWTPESYLVSGYSLLNPSLDEKGRALQQAEILGQAKDFSAASKLLRDLLKQEPADSQVWLQLGQVLLLAKDYDGSIEASLRAAEAKDLRIRGLYNVACGYSLKADNTRALEYLGKAVDAGLWGDWAMADPDLENVRKDPRFQKLAARLMEPPPASPAVR